jgi:hypothetical protein
MPTQIKFLFFADCPFHEEALARLRAVVAEEQIEAEIEIIEVTTEAEAQRHRFAGSPTILVNGQDIAPPAADIPPNALTCRTYHQENGRMLPLPSVEMIRRALQ